MVNQYSVQNGWTKLVNGKRPPPTPSLKILPMDEGTLKTPIP